MADGKVKAFFADFKEHWSTPAPGKYVPYKEYLSIFGAVGGNYALSYVSGFLSFGTGCYLVAFYYQIPILTFSAIITFFIATGYLWSILGMGVDANLGFLPKKTQAKYFAVYLSFAALGLVLMIFNLSQFLPQEAQGYLMFMFISSRRPDWSMESTSDFLTSRVAQISSTLERGLSRT